MKKLLILLLLASPLMGQESNKQSQINYPYINNSLKLYTALGLPVGIGLLYAPELRSSINHNVLHVFNFDFKFIGIDLAADSINKTVNHLLTVGFGFGFQYSVGTILASGSRFYVDLIGVGYHAGVLAPGGSYVAINLLGFQSTLSNGFYWGVRNQAIYEYIKAIT